MTDTTADQPLRPFAAERPAGPQSTAADQAAILRAILAATASEISLLDPQGRYIHASARVARVLGLPQSALAGKTGHELGFPAAVMDRLDAERETVLLTRQPVSGTLSYESLQGGGPNRLEYEMSPMTAEDGALIGVIVSSQDVTERDRIEAALRRAEALTRAIVRSSDDAIVSKTLDGIVTSWNPAAERLFGYTAEEMIGNPIRVLAAPGRESEMPAILERLRRGERVDHYETVRRRKDGRLVEISLTVSPVRDPEGRLIGASKIARDIGERKRFIAELHRQRQQLDIALEAGHIGTWEFNVETGHYSLADSALRLFGFAPGQGMPSLAEFSERVHPEDRERVRTTFRAAVENRTSYEIEHRIVLPDGTVRWITSRGHLVPDGAGRMVELVGALVDVTSLRRAVEEQRRATEARELMLRELHHRVRNNMQLITSMVRLQVSTTADAEIRRRLQEAQQRVLTFARVQQQLYEAGQVQTVEFGGFLERFCADFSQALSNEKNCTIAVEAEEVELTADQAVNLSLIASELILNVVKHAYPGQQQCPMWVTFGLSEEGEVRLTVADEGVGLPETLSPVAGRGGLGTMLMRGLVEKLGGRLESERLLPSGMRFTVLFPREPRSEPGSTDTG